MSWKTEFSIFIAVTLFFFAGCGNHKIEKDSREGYYSLKIKDTVAWVEIADSEKKRRQGLMYRESLPEDAGMLFVYPAPQRQSFWMKNTWIPLSIAFIRKDGTISEILAMEPTDGRPDFMLPRYESKEEVMYSLEMAQGWFEKHGITPGTKVTLPAVVEYMLKLDDFKDFAGLVSKLQSAKDPISLYLQQQLSPEMKLFVQNFETNHKSSISQKARFVDEINFLLCRERLWQKEFIPSEWQQPSEGMGMTQMENRIYRNRLLLEKAFSLEIQSIARTKQ